MESCDNVKKHIKPLNFLIGNGMNSEKSEQYYVMKPESFLIDLSGEEYV